MDDHRSPQMAIALVVVLGAIVAGALATRAFDEMYFAPLCRRHGEATQMEFVSLSSGYRRQPLSCVFNLYYEDGSLRASVNVPLSSIQQSPVEYALGSLRWTILVGLVLPAVWLARKVIAHDD
jgi:hypothetical protein